MRHVSRDFRVVSQEFSWAQSTITPKDILSAVLSTRVTPKINVQREMNKLPGLNELFIIFSQFKVLCDSVFHFSLAGSPHSENDTQTPRNCV